MKNREIDSILNYLWSIGFKADFRTAFAAIAIIDCVNNGVKACEEAAKKYPTIEQYGAKFYDGRFWIIHSLNEWHSLSFAPKTTLRRLLKRLDFENIVNRHVFDEQKHIVGYSLHDQIREYLK